jgi:excisionase family DNA binding protein
MAGRSRTSVEPLLTAAQVAALLGATERFPRRLIAERRIRFVRVGRQVRIPESGCDRAHSGHESRLARHYDHQGDRQVGR